VPPSNVSALAQFDEGVRPIPQQRRHKSEQKVTCTHGQPLYGARWRAMLRQSKCQLLRFTSCAQKSPARARAEEQLTKGS